MVFPVLATDGESVAVHRAALRHILDAHADDKTLRTADASEIHFHLAVGKIPVQIVPVKGIRRCNVQRAASQFAADAARVQLPFAHAILEIMAVQNFARRDILHTHFAHFHRGRVRPDKQAARIVFIRGTDIVEHELARIARKHLLHKIVRREHDVARIEPDQVGRPFIVRRRSKQGRVTGHLDHVAVALAPREERRFRNGRAKIVFAVEPAAAVAHGMHRIFAHEHLCAVTIVTIVPLCVVDKPLIGIVHVLVDDGIAVFLIDDFPTFARILRADVDARRRHDLNIVFFEEVDLRSRIFVLFQPEQASRKVFKILVSPVFVADADVLQRERRRVPHIRTDFCPIGFGGIGAGNFALGKEQKVCDVVDDFALEHRRARHDAAVPLAALFADADLAEKPAMQNRQRCHVQVFTQAEVFIEADRIRLHVAPRVGDLFA